MGLFDDCDILRDCLWYFDVISVILEEYDKIYWFLCLWWKLGWMMMEFDIVFMVFGVFVIESKFFR